MTPEDKLVMEKTFQMLDEDKVVNLSHFFLIIIIMVRMASSQPKI